MGGKLTGRSDQTLRGRMERGPNDDIKSSKKDLGFAMVIEVEDKPTIGAVCSCEPPQFWHLAVNRRTSRETRCSGPGNARCETEHEHIHSRGPYGVTRTRI